MKLQEARLRNFKSIQETTIRFPKDFLGLVGENDSGKSNIIEALDFFFHRPPRVSADELAERTYMHQRDRQIEVCCVFTSLTDSDRARLARYVLGNRIIVKRTATIGDERSSIKCQGAIGGSRFEDFEWSATEFEGFKETNQRNIPEFLHIPAIRDVTDETSKKGDKFGDIISRILQSIPQEDLAELFGMQRRVGELLNFNGEGADSRHASIKALETELSGLLSPYRDGLKAKLTFPIPDFRDSGIPQILLDDGVKGPPNSKGHGMQSILYLAIFRLYEKYLVNAAQEDRRPLIFAIDEPEIYLHPALQRTMFRTLQEISRVDQVIISTHSPNFVDMMNYETIAKIARAEQGTNVKQPPDGLVPPDPRERLRIFSRFNPSRNEMFFSRKTVFVEGDSDKFAILSTADFCDKNLDAQGIAVIETNGKQNLPYYIRIANAFGIPFGVAYDSDDGNPQSNEASTAIETAIAQSPHFVSKVVFQPSLETELGLSHHTNGVEVLQHFERMSRDAIPSNIRSFVESMCSQ